MTNDELNEIKVNIEVVSVHITKMIANMNSLAESMNNISAEDQPEEFTEAAKLYAQAKNQLTSYLLTAIDAFGLALLDVIEYVQSSPKQKLGYQME